MAVTQKKRILCVDDERDVLNSIVELLTIKGYEAIGASDPLEAERLWLERDFDGALVDLSMPVPEGYDIDNVQLGMLTGLEMAERMHRAKPDLPIVSLTVVPKDWCGQRWKSAGIVAYVNKPTEPEHLIETLRSAL